jgi:two-component system sensor histidine kinase KdpD
VNEEARPDPDLLLRRLQVAEARQKRAKLKVFFGFAPGVGKTYAMLQSAHRLLAEGTEVVVGYVETHGRGETASLLTGLEAIARRSIEYRGARLEEFDLDQALVRHPQVLLLDELAHTNAAGVRHKKRWQDVLDLLDAGIDVHTTLNVQHVESLNDVVAQVTQVRVRETVPDAILDRADEIELVDLPPDALLLRLREGKVYLGEQASRAAQHFFQRGNLLALRELALRRTADRVDADMQAYREEHSIEATWPAAERILVCIGPSPASARLVRATRRMAAGLRAPWVAACVEVRGAAPLQEEARARLAAHLALAESLGGEVARLTGTRVSDTLLDHARKHNVTRLVIGKPTHARLRDLVRGSLLDEVVRGSGDIDVHVISGDEAPAPREAREPPSEAVDWGAFASAAALVVGATALAAVGRTWFALPDLVMIYLLVIMVAATRLGRGPSVLAAALSVGFYDFFFIPPYYTFSVSDAHHILTFGMMFGVGLVISGLTSRVRRQEQDARRREERTAALYALSRELGSAPDEDHVARALARQAAQVLASGAAVLTGGEGSALQILGREGTIDLDAPELGVARWVLDHGRPAGLGTDTLPGARVRCIPLGNTASPLGVLALAPQGGRVDDPDFLAAFARQGSLALERSRLAEDARAAVLRARTEEMRSSLLSAVSHDLRTPLAAITGAATTLRDDSSSLPAAARADLLAAICEEAERLERLVANLLDMTRLESGALRVKREWIPLEEMVGSALGRLESRLGPRPIHVHLPADLPLLSVDPILIEQLLVNLLENAAKYTPPEASIDIGAREVPDGIEIEVADRGPGLPEAVLEKIFEKFYRGAHVGIGGVGLGLPICRGIAEAHGGTLRASNREGGGARFVLTLPPQGAPPDAPAADPEAPPDARSALASAAPGAHDLAS